MAKTQAGAYHSLDVNIPSEFEGNPYMASQMTSKFIVSFYTNSKTALVHFPGQQNFEKITTEGKAGCSLVSKYSDAFYFYVYPEELHVLTYDQKFSHESINFKSEGNTISGTSLILENEKNIYCISNSKIVTIEKKSINKPKNVCPLDNSFSSFAKESCVLPNNRVLLADSVVNMGNVHFKVWDLVSKKVVAQMYRVVGENEPSYSQVFHNTVFMSMGTSIYQCDIKDELNPDELVTLEFSKHEFHDRSIQSFSVEQDYVFVGDSYGMVTVHSYPGFHFHNTIDLGIERDEQVKYFDERPVFSFRNSVVGMKRVYKYLIYWLLNGTVCIGNFFATEKRVDTLSFQDTKHQLRDVNLTFGDKLGIVMRFNVLKRQNSAIVPINEFYQWDVTLPSPVPQKLAYVGFFEMLPQIISGIYNALDGGNSKQIEKLRTAVKECYFTIVTINNIKERSGAIIPYEFFADMVNGLAEAHSFSANDSKKSPEEICQQLTKALTDLQVMVDDSVAISMNKIDMLRDPKFFNASQTSSFAVKTINFRESVRSHFMEMLLDPKYVIDDNDHRMKFFYMNNTCFLRQKQNDFTKHINHFNDFCVSNDVGALVDAPELVKVNALLTQIRDEIEETRGDIKDFVSQTFASDKWLHELDYISQQVPTI
ncbi:hypothetical protein EIN_134380 [Entamoeba invadens IP1]|uniref:Uncharacterized protein n=1 Tax=Entamoeba invadens IP1 TaxID=370355 RepID=A0A0A1U2W4_ENTIV|nr:hypothetical protein EIN_134380 [Entamoeba invadens IP1]ELP85894.1 hypothetical protein EIN_134380 [Entamoeba invadens IP1]|eukprot:XP_004185240.1 hypothetical protein EIN_134380 [Entamoeba invadens IP1]